MTKNTGGPYHPIERQDRNDYNGITLRDHFAGLAMQAIIAMPDSDNDYEYIEEVVADNAYRMADAMIAQRSK